MGRQNLPQVQISDQVSATNYGWRPNSIGDRTDIPNWPEWFTGLNSSTYLSALYNEFEKVVRGVGSSNNVVGGSALQARNLISSNGHVGVEIGPTGNNRVQGNYIGTDVTGVTALPNNTDGVYIFNVSNGNLIGGTAEGQANLIAFNGDDGVEVLSGSYGAKYNTITRNRIHSNAGKGIALPGGGNEGLAAPVITIASATQVSGTACANCTIEVFSDAADEGAIYEGTTTADGSGYWTFTKASQLIGPYVTAAATDAAGNTSEFSAPVSVAPTATLKRTVPAHLPAHGLEELSVRSGRVSLDQRNKATCATDIG